MGKIITQRQASKLVRDGKAVLTGATKDEGRWYQIVTRYDLQRVDHYPIDDVSDAIDEITK